MNQQELNREVARKTGESVRTIASLGFQEEEPEYHELDREPLVVDWDQLEAARDRRWLPAMV